MDVKDFYYDLPQELIAQDPLEDRSSSRLLVLKKGTGEVGHTSFRHIVDYLEPGDCLVLNNTKVIPARLLGEREGTGGKVEILLLKRRENDVWETLVKPGKKAKPGTRIFFGDGLLIGEITDVVEDGADGAAGPKLLDGEEFPQKEHTHVAEKAPGQGVKDGGAAGEKAAEDDAAEKDQQSVAGAQSKHGVDGDDVGKAQLHARDGHG